MEKKPSKLNFSNSDFTISIELCPKREHNMKLLKKISPDFYSVIWHSFELDETRIDKCPPLVCSESLLAAKMNVLMHVVGMNLEQNIIECILREAKKIGVRNLLVLQGDTPPFPDPTKKTDFKTAEELIKFIRRKFGDYFGIGMAAYPEMHPKSESIEDDFKYLKAKINAGGEFIITQAIFKYEALETFLKNCKRFGVINIPIIVGIYLIDSFVSLRAMSDICKVKVPDDIWDYASQNIDHPDVVKNYGISLVIELIKNILTKADKSMIKGIHLFAANDLALVETILTEVGIYGEKGIERSIIKKKIQEGGSINKSIEIVKINREEKL